MRKSKKCKKCNENKQLGEFELRKDSGTYRGSCILCQNAVKAGWYANDVKEQRTKRKKYRDNNKERAAKINAKYYQENQEKILKRTKIYREKNKDKIRIRKREYERKRRKEDTNYRISKALRSRLRDVIKSSYTKRKAGSAVRDLGCTVGELKLHLESKFTKGMSWDNHGEWHIDHIIPLASFNLTNREQVKVACHYTNLQPLWAEDNLKKGARMPPDQGDKK